MAGNDVILGGSGNNRIGQAYPLSRTAEDHAGITLANGSFVVLQGITPGNLTSDVFV